MPEPLRSVLVAALAALPAGAQDPEPANTAAVPAAREGGALARHELIQRRLERRRGAVDLLFVGDSITQAFENAGKQVWDEHYTPRGAFNFGISGDRTEHVLWRLAHSDLRDITPKVTVVMIGTNNFGHRTHEAPEVLQGVRAVVAALRDELPDTKILLLGIFPRGAEMNPMRGDVLQVNQALHALRDGDRVEVLDIGHHFVEPDGSIAKAVMPDALHLSPEGYRRWAAAMEPTLRRMLGEPGGAR